MPLDNRIIEDLILSRLSISITMFMIPNDLNYPSIRLIGQVAAMDPHRRHRTHRQLFQLHTNHLGDTADTISRMSTTDQVYWVGSLGLWAEADNCRTSSVIQWPEWAEWEADGRRRPPADSGLVIWADLVMAPLGLWANSSDLWADLADSKVIVADVAVGSIKEAAGESFFFNFHFYMAK